jgi:hypothetical protein
MESLKMAKQNNETTEMELDDVELNPSLEDEQDDIDENIDDSDSEDESTNKEEDEDELDDEDDVHVSFGDEEPETLDDDDGTRLIKKLRKIEREKSKEIRVLRKQLEEKENLTENKPVKLSEKPKLEDFDYDSDTYDSALLDWHEKKRDYDKQELAKLEEKRQAQASWEQSLNKYRERKQELGFKDFDYVEEQVSITLSPAQQNLMIDALDDPAKFVNAIGRSPEKLQELAAIKNPVKFIAAVAKLEDKAKVEKQTRKPSVQPERRVKGTGQATGQLENKLKQLEAKAEQSGDRSQIIAFKRKHNL